MADPTDTAGSAGQDRITTTAAGPILRVGRKVKRTIYLQRGPEPSDADRIVGLMDDGTLAAAVAAAFNRQSANDRTYWLDGLDD